MQLHSGLTSPPKPLDTASERLLRILASCGDELGVSIQWRDIGGVCDGNKRAATGLTNGDTLGMGGGSIHSRDGYLLLDSFVERAKLTAFLMMKLACGKITWQSQGGL